MSTFFTFFSKESSSSLSFVPYPGKSNKSQLLRISDSTKTTADEASVCSYLDPCLAP